MNFSDYKIGTKFTSLPTSLKNRLITAKAESKKIYGDVTSDNVGKQISEVSNILGEKYPSHLDFSGSKL